MEPDEVLAGRHPVVEALDSSTSISKVLISKQIRPSPIISRIEELATKRDIRIERVPRERMDQVARGLNHQGVIAYVSAFRYAKAAQLMSPERDPRLLLMDGITDPVNVGSILRSAEAFGFNGLLLPRHNNARVTPTVRKVAAGAAERVPVALVGSPAEAVSRMTRKGIFVVGLDPDSEMSYREADLGQPCCLVLGAEGRGLSRLVRDRCDALVSIPMMGRLASINVAVAAAVVMVEVTRDLAARQRLERGSGPRVTGSDQKISRKIRKI